MMKLSHLRPLQSKKTLLIFSAVGVLAVCGIGAYIIWSKQVWEDYTPAYTQRLQNIQDDITAIATLPATSIDEQGALLERLKDVSSRMASEEKTLCEVNGWVEWQQRFISSYGDARAECQEAATKRIVFRKQLDGVIAFINDEQALAKIISTVTPPTELADDAWEKQVAAWDGAIDEVAALSVSGSFKPTQQQAIERMTAVKRAWVEVNAAHQQKDKVKFLSARDALGVSYDELSVIANESTKSLGGLIKTLNAAHASAFQ